MASITPVSSQAITTYQKVVFPILPAMFLMGGLLSLRTHPLIAVLHIAIAAIFTTIWFKVIRHYRDVYSDGSSLVVDDRSTTVVPYDAILKVSSMFYLKAPVIVITYKVSTTRAKIYFVAIDDSIAGAFLDGTFFIKH